MFVSVNARLNYVGFLDLSSIGGDTNVGVADMVLSLQWVRDNIAKFGGDPSNVTILGQSGGGTKVTALASAPAAQGLFSKIAYISGGLATGRSPEEAAANAQKLVDYVRANVADLAKASDAEIFAYLQDLHYDTLVKHCEGAGGTYNVLYSLGDCFFYFMPILLAYTVSKKFGLPELEGMVIGAGLQILVMFGLHWAVVPLGINEVSVKGFTLIMPGMLGTTFAQMGAVAAIWVKSKNKKLKSLCPPAFISAIAGVTEPAIYGITLPKKTPFIITCVVSAIGGGVLGALNTVQYTMGALGIFSWPTFVNTATNDAHGMIVAIVVSLACTVAAFIGVLLTYSDET